MDIVTKVKINTIFIIQKRRPWMPASLSWLSTLIPIVRSENGNRIPSFVTYIPKPINTAHRLMPTDVAKLRNRNDKPSWNAHIDNEAYHPRIDQPMVSIGKNLAKRIVFLLANTSP